jgi:steroid delta-isomerase-like uncharacterized protein
MSTHDEGRTDMADERKELVIRIFEVINSGDFGAVDELIHPDYVDYSVPGQVFHGPDGFRTLIGIFRTAFPDLHVTVEDLIVEGDLAAWRSTTTGTHQGELAGVPIPPTGKAVSFESYNLGRIQDGKAIEHRALLDMLGLLQQLGVIQEMAPATA